MCLEAQLWMCPATQNFPVRKASHCLAARFSACQMLQMEDMPLIMARLWLMCCLLCSAYVLGAAVSMPVGGCLRVKVRPLPVCCRAARATVCWALLSLRPPMSCCTWRGIACTPSVPQMQASHLRL